MLGLCSIWCHFRNKCQSLLLEVSLLMITEKLPKSDIYYYKNDDLLDMNKFSYGMDEQKIFEQHFQQQIAAGSN